MNRPPVDRLSEKQREALRLLYDRHSPGEIARAIGVSIHAVNERLREARRVLGVGSSLTAARLLAEAEGRATYKDDVADAFGGASPANGSHPTDRPRSPWPWRSPERPTKTLSSLQVLLAILVLALLFMGAVGVFLIGTAWVNSQLRP